MTDIDWRQGVKWARISISSRDSKYGGSCINGNVYNQMEVVGLLATSEVTAN